MTRMHTLDMSPYIDAVILKGETVSSQARAASEEAERVGGAKVDPTQLRRLVQRDPRYKEAVAAGKIEQRPRLDAEQLRTAPHVLAVVRDGQSITDVATRFGMAEATVSYHVKKAFPDKVRRRTRVDGEVAAAEGGSTNVEAGPSKVSMLPLISWVRAGEWDVANDYLQPGDAEGWYYCPKPASDSSYVLRVRGDSMTAPSGAKRSYPEDSLIFVDPEKRAPVNGDRIIAKLAGSDEVTFKIYKNEDGRQWLMPLNPQHEPIREEFKVLGTVIGMWVD